MHNCADRLRFRHRYRGAQATARARAGVSGDALAEVRSAPDRRRLRGSEYPDRNNGRVRPGLDRNSAANAAGDVLPFAVFMELDPYGAAGLQPIIEHVERISPNAATPRSLNVEPHITLAVYDGLDPEPLARALDHFSADMRAPSVKLSSIGLFPGPASVLFAAPVVSAELLALHRDFHEAAASAGAACWPYYLPGNWVPHVTLGEQLSPKEAGAAISGAIGLWQPVAAGLHRISLVRFHPIDLLWHRQLPG